jgi:hypothetical protein
MGFRRLRGYERRWLAATLARLAADGVDLDDPASLGAWNDAAYESWSRAPIHRRPDAEDAFSMIGVGLGAYLSRRFSLSWWVSEEAGGSALALRSGSGAVYPVEAVRYRWRDGVTGFVPGYLDEVGRF